MSSEEAGRYVYCVALGNEEVSLGEIGIEKREVYTVVGGDLCALVHDCPSRPSEPDGAGALEAWVLSHHRVVDAAARRWSAVLPIAFNTIVRPTESTAHENLVAWLENDYESLRRRLEGLAGKAEYGVQVYLDVAQISESVATSDPEIRRLEEEMAGKSRGLAYMYRQKLERLLRQQIEARAAQELGDLMGRFSRCAARVQVERTKEAREGHQMLLNLSCLVAAERYGELQAEVEKIRAREGFSVRLIGPLPPYTFC